jgi:hypothetical protein
MATEKLNLTTRPKNKNPQIKNYKKSHELRLIRPQTQHKNSHELRLIRPETQYKNPQHMYLKFLKPPAPSVEKIISLLHGFKSVYKPRNINVLFSQCGS